MEQAALEQNVCAGHLVHFYKKSEYLSEFVAEYIHMGLSNGDGIIIVVTQDRWQLLKTALRQKVHAVEQHLAEQRLLFIDAHRALQRIMVDGRPSKKAFMEIVDESLHHMQRFPNIKVYGELIHLLCADGKVGEAIELEKHWTEILHSTPRLRLMCGYKAEHVAERTHSITEVHPPMKPVENITQQDDEEALYRRIAILEQRYASLKNSYKEKLHIENELTAIKKQLAQTGKLSILGELCAGIAHELNNPLAIILGSIKNSRDMVARASEPVSPTLQEVLKRLEYIDDATTRMSKIVRNVLMFARQEDHSFAALDIKGTLLQAIEFMQNGLRLERIQLQVFLPSDDLRCLGDYEAILQAFLNILSNARDALASTGPGTSRVLIVSAQRLGNERIEITFRDSGIGMDEQTLGKIFYPFFTTKAIGKGTGLGLAISHGIITKHKGRIFCESKPGQGTLVRVVLPQLEQQSAALLA
ncbi:ATP-binding protein [Oligoflexus tunisiensis]|uniref:ATP-binding protein n=1 Tax=Oligoflexus tunisiensis TaxID=708132 RepID=UPI00114D027B|nr:ATP-binding protein [Oligoflexus tunisiensis]